MTNPSGSKSMLIVTAIKQHQLFNIQGIAARQNADGSFAGDEEGEVDTRFSYCAISALKLLSSLERINVPSAVHFVQSCRNFDGGYGAVPGGESHAGQGTTNPPTFCQSPVFCAVGMLSILGMQISEADRLGEWLSWRQLKCGGLNGRPEKLEDVCYSWWVVASIAMLGRLDWIGREALQRFILDCQVSLPLLHVPLLWLGSRLGRIQ